MTAPFVNLTRYDDRFVHQYFHWNPSLTFTVYIARKNAVSRIQLNTHNEISTYFVYHGYQISFTIRMVIVISGKMVCSSFIRS